MEPKYDVINCQLCQVGQNTHFGVELDIHKGQMDYGNTRRESRPFRLEDQAHA